MCPNEKKQIPADSAQEAPVSPAGGPVVSCKLDEACVQVDCEQLAEDMAEVMDESPEAPDILLHYCGVDYLKQPDEAAKKDKP